MRFELFIAARYLRAKRKQAVIGVITAISVAGVTAGVASLVIALSINNGFRQDLQQRLLGATSHVSLLRVESDGIRDWRSMLDRLEDQPNVVAAAPAIYEQVLISRGARAKGAILKGVLPEYEARVSDLLQSVRIGSVEPLNPPPSSGNPSPAGNTAPQEQAPETEVQPEDASSLASVRRRADALPPVVLGKTMAEELGATIGSVVLVTSPQGELTPFGIVPKYVRFKVVGIFNSGFFDYDTAWAFTRLSDAQQLFGLGDLVSVIEFKVNDIYRASEVGVQLQQAAGQGYLSTNWMEQNQALFRALRLERVVTFITIGLIVFIAAL
ncbi:MAG: ABC transporter permease, partial [Candidatus Korobacteraceae bacterium]